MSILNTVKNGISKSLTSTLSKYINGDCAASPLSSLFKVVNSIKLNLTQRLERLDSLNVGFASVKSVLDSAVQRFKDRQVAETDISRDEVESLVSGFISAINHSDGGDSDTLMISDGEGLVYNFKIKLNGLDSLEDCDIISCLHGDTSSPFVWLKDGVFRISSDVMPINYLRRFSPDNWRIFDVSSNLCLSLGIESQTTILDNLEAVANHLGLTNRSTISGLISEIMTYYDIPDAGSVQANLSAIFLNVDVHVDGFIRTTVPFINLMKDMVADSEIVSFLKDVCDAVLNGKIKDFLNNIKEGLVSKVESVKNIWRGLVQGFNSNGIKGVINYVISIFSSVKNITLSEDGTMAFTDNSVLIPKQYIAGIISTVTYVLGNVVSAIVSIFQPIIGMAISAINNVVWGIVGSIAGDYNDTYASLEGEYDEAFAYQVFNLSPIAGFQTSTSEIPQWYIDMYNDGCPIVIIEVPGGAVLVGPGRFNALKTEVTWLRLEFHSAVGSYDMLSSTIARYMDDYITFDAPNYYFDLNKYYANQNPNKTLNFWKTITSTPMENSEIYNQSNGHLSSTGDSHVRWLIEVGLTMFIMWILEDSSFDLASLEISGLIVIDTGIGALGYSYLNSIWRYHNDQTYQFPNASWNDVISSFSQTNNDSNAVRLTLVEDTWQGQDHIDLRIAMFNRDYVALALNDPDLTPYAVPDAFRCILNVPKYDQSTFFLWIAAVTIAVVATTIAVNKITRYFRGRINKLKSRNIARFNEAQSNYFDAVNGTKSVYNEETHQYEDVPFDVSSSEGKRYIEQCYSEYRTTAWHNNLWQKVIGGTRYDIGSFWGCAEDDETSSIESLKETIEENFSSMFDNEDSSGALNSTSQKTSYAQAIFAAVTGKQIEFNE